MHTEILSENQKKLLNFLSNFKKEYYLVRGTAIALQIGHRESIDFDLFTEKNIKRKQIKNIFIKNDLFIDKIIYEAFDQMHLIINSVKFTFFQFPHKISSSINYENIIKMPDLLNLTSMKFYALGGRAKWKDYVDIYFLLKNHIHFKNAIENTQKVFGTFFNAKLLKEQLSYFADVDYSEPVTYVGKEQPTEQEIKEFLTEQALIEF
ncbi:MAG: hypothetical protein JXR68_08695 [Bacteroidales bacterium]|nr:hypothetical protein [Bacteroidales bacterium]